MTYTSHWLAHVLSQWSTVSSFCSPFSFSYFGTPFYLGSDRIFKKSIDLRGAKEDIQHVLLRLSAEEKVRTREGARRGVRRRERMKRGSGMKDREERSSGMETLIAEALAKIKPTEPSVLAAPPPF